MSNPAAIPDGRVKLREPFARVELICNQEHVGSLMLLAQSRRGEMVDQRHLGLGRVKLVYSLPLSELVTDFHDEVKSKSSGFASMNYDMEGMRDSKLSKLDVHIAGEPVDGYVLICFCLLFILVLLFFAPFSIVEGQLTFFSFLFLVS